MFNIQEALKDIANEFKYLQDTSVEALEMDLLWENANPTAIFAAQTITLDLSEYEWVRIIATVSYWNGSAEQKQAIKKVGDFKVNELNVFTTSEMANAANYYVMSKQRAINVTTSGITFSTGYVSRTTAAPTTDNLSLIPHYIYGIKSTATSVLSGGIKSLPIASVDSLGGVKIGEGLKINEEGLLSIIGGNSTLGGNVPVGTILEYGGSEAPKNWLFLDGSAISRYDYAELFEIYGTKYGAGDGSSTFNLPDFRGRVPIGLNETDTDFDTLGNIGGEKEHQLTNNELPADMATFNPLFWATNVQKSGIATVVQNHADRASSAGTQWGDATVTLSGGNQAHNNLQPYIVVNYIVKAKSDTADDTLTEEKDIKTLLWTNPSPATEFAAQTIDLDLSEYDSVCIEYRPFVSYSGTKSVTAPIGTTALGDLSMSNLGLVNGSATYNGFRHMEITESGINVKQGYSYSAADNRNVIPVRIYGVKDKINITTPVVTDKGIYTDLLWENASPTSAFAAQTIELDLNGYDMVEIYSYGRTGQSGYSYGYNSDRFLIGEYGNIQNNAFIGSSIDYILVESRPLNVTKTGITFEKGSTLYTNSSTHTAGVTSNGSAVPYQIYGIKHNAATTSTIMGDYVVEQEENENWAWKKWNSGVVELYGHGTITGTTPSSLMSGYYSYGNTPAYPFSLTDSAFSANSNARLGTGLGWSNIVADKNLATIYCVGNQSSNQITYTCMIRGRWK